MWRPETSLACRVIKARIPTATEPQRVCHTEALLLTHTVRMEYRLCCRTYENWEITKWRVCPYDLLVCELATALSFNAFYTVNPFVLTIFWAGKQRSFQCILYGNPICPYDLLGRETARSLQCILCCKLSPTPVTPPPVLLNSDDQQQSALYSDHKQTYLCISNTAGTF